MDDIKEDIAAAAKALMSEGTVRKLTVTDIVERCNITRQAFYYHFENIPKMMEWILEKESDKLLAEIDKTKDIEAGLKRFFLLAVRTLPYARRSLESSYREEVEIIVSSCVEKLCTYIIDEMNLYKGYSRKEIRFIVRYHSQAILGLLKTWGKEDMNNIDNVVHNTFLLLSAKVIAL